MENKQHLALQLLQYFRKTDRKYPADQRVEAKVRRAEGFGG